MGSFVWGFIKGILGDLFGKIFGTDKASKLENENIGLRKKATRARSEVIAKTNEMAYTDAQRKRAQEKKDAKSKKDRVDITSRRYRKP